MRTSEPTTPTRQVVRIGLRAAVVALVVAAAVPLIRGADKSSGSQVDASAPVVTVPLGSTPATSNPTTGAVGTPALGGIASPGGSIGVGTGDGSAIGDGGSRPTTSGSPSTTPVTPAEGPVIISPTLGIFRFGTQVGLPLVCNVAVSALANGIPDQSIAAIAGQISTACGQMSSAGIEGINLLNDQLRALGAANPALEPAIEQFAQIFDVDPADTPLASFFKQFAGIVRFFA